MICTRKAKVNSITINLNTNSFMDFNGNMTSTEESLVYIDTESTGLKKLIVS